MAKYIYKNETVLKEFIGKFLKSLAKRKGKQVAKVLAADPEMKKMLNQAGIKCKIARENMTIYGKNKIYNQNKSILTKTKGDHRICMSSVIFSLVTGIRAKINNFETVNTSFPGFIPLIKNLGGKIVIK